MHDQCTVVISAATARSESGCGRFRTKIRTIDLIVSTAKKIFPINTAASLASLAGVGVRAAEAWIHEGANISADPYTNILRSKRGLDFYEPIMEGSECEAWKNLQRRLRAADLEAKIQKLEQELDAVRRGDQEA